MKIWPVAESPLNLRKKIAGIDPGRDPLIAARLRVKPFIIVFYSEEDDLTIFPIHPSVSPVSTVILLIKYFFLVTCVCECVCVPSWASPSCSLISANLGMCKIDRKSFLYLCGESLIIDNNLTSYMCYRMYVPTLIYSLLLQGTQELDRRAVDRPEVPAWYHQWVQTQDVAVDRPISPKVYSPAQFEDAASQPFSKEELQESLWVNASRAMPRAPDC